MHTYIHTYIYTYIHTHIHTCRYDDTYMHTYISTCIHTNPKHKEIRFKPVKSSCLCVLFTRTYCRDEHPQTHTRTRQLSADLLPPKPFYVLCACVAL